MSSIGRHIALVLVLFLSSCADKEEVVIPTDVIPMTQMSDIITDMTITEAVKNLNLSKEFSSAESFAGFYIKIYEDHGVSEADFKRSFEFYESHQALMSEIYQGTSQKLKMFQDTIQKKEVPASLARDENQIKRDSIRNKRVKKPLSNPQR